MRPRKPRLSSPVGIQLRLQQCLSQRRTQLLLQWRHRCSVLHSSHDVKPVRIRIVYIRRAHDLRHRLDRQIVIRRCRNQPVPAESLRGHPDHRHRLRIHPERAPHHLRISSEVPLPRRVTDHCSHRSALRIVGIREQAPLIRPQPKCPEVVPRHILPITDFGSVSGPSLRTVTGRKVNPA